MPCHCPACQQLLSTGKRHKHLLTISHISHSELVKCTLCHAFYLHEDGRWELISSANDAFTPPIAVQYKQLLQN